MFADHHILFQKRNDDYDYVDSLFKAANVYEPS